MKKIEKFQTIDGRTFDSQEEARKHLDALYFAKLVSLEVEISKLAYSEIRGFIVANLDRFIELQRIENDFMLEDYSFFDDDFPFER
jgi:hypothetical protein